MIVYLALAISLSYLFSQTIYIFTFFTGLYLGAMGLGVYVVEMKADLKSDMSKWILINSLLGIIVANPLIIGLMFFHEWIYGILVNTGADYSFFIFPAGVFLTILIGIISGAELPIFSKLIEEKKFSNDTVMQQVLTSDYVGAGAGIFLFTFILFPFCGLITSIVLAQMISLFVIAIMYFFMNIFHKKRIITLLVSSLLIYVIMFFIFREKFFVILNQGPV
jgi:spermidine synthase